MSIAGLRLPLSRTFGRSRAVLDATSMTARPMTICCAVANARGTGESLRQLAARVSQSTNAEKGGSSGR